MTIYFIRAGRNVKIGYTAGDPHRRLKALQTANARRLRLMASMPGKLEDEKRLHDKFAEERRSGEWFRLSWRIQALIRSVKGWHLEVPERNDGFLEHVMYYAWPDLHRGKYANAASCDELAVALSGLYGKGKTQYANWRAADVTEALRAYGIATKPIEFEDGTIAEGVLFDEVHACAKTEQPRGSW